MKITKFISLLMLTYLTPVFCSGTEGQASTSIFSNHYMIAGGALFLIIVVYIIYSRRSK